MRSRVDWHLRTRTVSLGERTLLMGILNATPDSFSDGGLYAGHEAAVLHGLHLLDEGAEILDIGGESTRPNATPLSSIEEQERILPVINAILREYPNAIVSVDTYHAETAQAALDAGVEIVNDVSGLLWDARMSEVVARARCGLVLMHTRGRPKEWAAQTPLPLDQVVPHVLAHLHERLAFALEQGISADRITVDPGFGFGIRGEENFPLLAGLSRLQTLNRPILSGTSRKGFLRRALTSQTPEALTSADAAVNTAAILAGAHILRVHDIAPARAAANIADAILATAPASR